MMKKLILALPILTLMSAFAAAQESDPFILPHVEPVEPLRLDLTLRWDGIRENRLDRFVEPVDPFAGIGDLKILENPALGFDTETSFVSLRLLGQLDLGAFEFSVVTAINLRPGDILGAQALPPSAAGFGSQDRPGNEIDLQVRYAVAERLRLTLGFAALIASGLPAGNSSMVWVGFELRF